MEDQELKIYFGSKIANLYDVGYLSTDIQQLIAFSDLISESDVDSLDKYFGEQIKGLNRYAKPLEKASRQSQISDVRSGSIEFVLQAVGVAASIIVPIAIFKAQSQLKKEGIDIKFEISPSDKNIVKYLNAYEKGDYGTGLDALNFLFEMLSKLNYNTSVISDNAYRIEHVTEKVAQRMVKTIRRNL